MKVQILSDQHLEFKKNFGYFENRCVARADTLVIAGDFFPHGSNEFVRETHIENRLLAKWKNVVLIPGNHEFYGATYEHKFFGEAYEVYEHSNGNKCHYVNNGIVEIDGVHFVCTTLWSHIGYDNAYHIQNSMNDYYQIRGLSVDKVNKFYATNVEFLVDAMSKIPKGKKCVIVTHHVPSYNLISPRWRGSRLNDAFSADMDVFIMTHSDKISHWIHGHSHDAVDQYIDGIRFIRNPMGYPQERDVDMDMVIRIN